MRNLAGLWQQLLPADQCRLTQLLIDHVVIADDGLEIIWRDQGWQDLAGELLPGNCCRAPSARNCRNGSRRRKWHESESPGFGRASRP